VASGPPLGATPFLRLSAQRSAIAAPLQRHCREAGPWSWGMGCPVEAGREELGDAGECEQLDSMWTLPDILITGTPGTGQQLDARGEERQ